MDGCQVRFLTHILAKINYRWGELQSKDTKVKIRNVRGNVRNVALHASSEGNPEAIKGQIRHFCFYKNNLTFWRRMYHGLLI